MTIDLENERALMDLELACNVLMRALALQSVHHEMLQGLGLSSNGHFLLRVLHDIPAFSANSADLDSRIYRLSQQRVRVLWFFAYDELQRQSFQHMSFEMHDRVAYQAVNHFMTILVLKLLTYLEIDSGITVIRQRLCMQYQSSNERRVSNSAPPVIMSYSGNSCFPTDLFQQLCSILEKLSFSNGMKQKETTVSWKHHQHSNPLEKEFQQSQNSVHNPEISRHQPRTRLVKSNKQTPHKRLSKSIFDHSQHNQCKPSNRRYKRPQHHTKVQESMYPTFVASTADKKEFLTGHSQYLQSPAVHSMKTIQKRDNLCSYQQPLFNKTNTSRLPCEKSSVLWRKQCDPHISQTSVVSARNLCDRLNMTSLPSQNHHTLNLEPESTGNDVQPECKSQLRREDLPTCLPEMAATLLLEYVKRVLEPPS